MNASHCSRCQGPAVRRVSKGETTSFLISLSVPPLSLLGLPSYPDERMTVPPYATGFVIALVGAYIGDRWRCRMALISFGGALGLIVSPKLNLIVAG